MSLVRASATIGSLTLVSRLLGFVRDMMIASFLGAGMLADAFLVAFKLPNFMRQLFAEGAFNAAFVPLYAGTHAVEGPDAARKFAEEVQAALTLILIILVIVAIIFMPQLMVVLAPGFESDPQKYKITILLTRITFPYILFISLVSLQGGLLNSVGRFAAVAGTPIIMNICLIGAMLLVSPFTPTTAHALSIGVLASGVAQYVWLFYYCRKAGVSPRFVCPRMTVNVKKLLTLIWPAALGSSVTQINLVVNVIIASLIPGAVSILYYAVRISELPFGVIGIAVSTALLPMLSRHIREGNIAAALHDQNRALELSFLFGIPATLALIAIPRPIVSVIYQHGAFSAADTVATYQTLIAFAVGLPASLAVKIFASTFYANHDTRTPVKIAIVAVVANLLLNLVLMHSLRYVGLALSTSISITINAVLLAFCLHTRKLFVVDDIFTFRVARIIGASFVMGFILWLLNDYFARYLEGALLVKITMLSGLIGAGILVYGGCLLALGVLKPAQMREYFTRKA
jgi:putative peptidoglycan lipid II flippase